MAARAFTTVTSKLPAQRISVYTCRGLDLFPVILPAIQVNLAKRPNFLGSRASQDALVAFVAHSLELGRFLKAPCALRIPPLSRAQT